MSPAMQPVANRGMEAAGMARLGLIVKLMEDTVPMLGAGSDAGQSLIKALSSLSKHVAGGSQSPGVEAAAIQNLQNQARQNAMRIAAMRAQAQGQGAGAGGPPTIPPPMQPQMAA
jgi:hypothetical protein